MGAEGEPVDDGGGEPGVTEGLAPIRTRRVEGDGDEESTLRPVRICKSSSTARGSRWTNEPTEPS